MSSSEGSLLISPTFLIVILLLSDICVNEILKSIRDISICRCGLMYVLTRHLSPLEQN